MAKNSVKNIERPKASSLKPLKLALPFMKPYTARLLLALIFLTLASLSMLSMPVAIRYVIDQGFSSNNAGSINTYFIALFSLAVAFAIFGSLRYYLVMWIGERVVADIRSAVYKHVIKMSPTFFEVTRTGEVLSRLTTDTTLVQSVFGAGMSIALRSLFSVFGCLIMLFITSPKLTSMIIILIPVVVVPILVYGRKVRRLSRANQDRVADSSSIADESLNAIHVIQAFTLETFLGDRFSDSVEESFKAARQRIQVSSILSGTIILTAFGAMVFVLWLGAHAVVDGSMSPGTMGQFLLYATFLAGSTTSLGEVWNDIQRAAGAMERLMELLHTQPEIKAPDNVVSLPTEGRGHIQIEDVCFNYPSRPGMKSLEHFSLEIKPGETVALVGPSGAGKSTVFQLLMRFYDPQSGKILLDGVDIKSADPLAVRQRIAIVPQNTVLFAATAMENIRYGKPEATDEEVKTAARTAIADEFIEKQPEAYQTFLGEKGIRLSGGQQQRIAIARAILKNPPIMLLDEATSALDSESEKLVQEALDHLMQDHTTLVIAHRLSTVMKADRIVVMDEGQIVDIGQHDELMQKGGLYNRLAEIQFGHAKEKDSTV
ncbi:MAG TPA: ATP-binding cassette domain-containing protein [Thiotrichaceae bacterium]|jgi:ATP-binding cassette subfamily B protein|nr:ATP-binding cassette domain-containing protein [Thiotrichaceae bacterium]HIM08655.1 ATP-binding cassette domain-containing protein [Gammaproteobacteria bacterium]